METTNEIWRKCPAPYLRYEVSNLGRVRNAHTGQILKPRKDQKGYMIIDLCWQGNAKTYKVHRLVALAFCEGYSKDLEVNHRNGIKSDNYAGNLEWVTRSENQQHNSNNLLVNVRPLGLFRNGRLCYLFPSTKAFGRYFGNNARRNVYRGYRIHGYTPLFIDKRQYREIVLLVNVHRYTLHAAFVESLTPGPSPDHPVLRTPLLQAGGDIKGAGNQRGPLLRGGGVRGGSEEEPF